MIRLLWLGLALATPARGQPPARPDVILVVVDDLRFDDPWAPPGTPS